MEFTELPEVAKNIYYDCTKCDRERYFKVLAHTSETTAKLQCEVCGAKRKLDIAKKKKKAKKAKTAKKARKKATTKKVLDHQEVYSGLQEKNEGKAPVAYLISGNFAKDMVIDHPSFGVGYVTSCMGHKLEVVFEEGVKDLIHQYGQ